jgi:hypothetical protein
MSEQARGGPGPTTDAGDGPDESFTYSELLTRLDEAAHSRPNEAFGSGFAFLKRRDGAWDIAIVIDGRYTDPRFPHNDGPESVEVWRDELSALIKHKARTASRAPLHPQLHSDHELWVLLRRLADPLATVTSTPWGTPVRVAGIATEVHLGRASSYATLVDRTGKVDVILPLHIFDRVGHLFQPDKVVVIQGPTVDGDSAVLIADMAWWWDDPVCAVRTTLAARE